jgi:hypothetical protein
LGSRFVVALVLGACVLPPTVAHAGSYDVYSCRFGSSFYGNNAWTPVNNSGAGDASFTAPDATCAQAGDPLVALMRPGNASTPNVAYARGISSELLLTPPANTRIIDFELNVRHLFNTFTNSSGTHTQNNTGYTLVAFGGSGVSLTGQWDANPSQTASIATDKHYYPTATPGGPVPDTGVVTLTRASSTLARNAEGAPNMALFAGCWANAAANCNLDDVSVAQVQLIGSRVTIEDTLHPAVSGVQAGAGLLALGVRSGSEPVTFSATDNSGIRRSEIVDVTDAGNPAVVASEDYATGPNTDAGTRCDYTRPRPCPDLTNEAIAAPTPLAGHRTLIVRVTDAGGETAVSPPFSVYARGPLNGSNGGDGARLVAGFPAKVFRGKGKKRQAVFVLRPSRTVSYAKGALIRGTLKGANGQPVGGADVRVLVREDRIGAGYVDRGGVTTGADGRFRVGVPAGSSRLFRLSYRAYKGDDGFVSRSTSTLNVRARIRVHGPKHVRRHGTAKFSGRLVGKPFPRRGVTLDLQIFQPHVGWRVFGNTRTRKSGTFTVRYRFQRASRGRFTFRIRLRPNDAYPYARGVSHRMRVRVG